MLVLDSNLADISASVFGATVTVTSGTDTAEPASSVLVGIAFAVFALAVFRRRLGWPAAVSGFSL